MFRQHNDAIVWIYIVKCCVQAHKRRYTLSPANERLSLFARVAHHHTPHSADISLLQIQNCEVYANVDECRSPGARVQVSGGGVEVECPARCLGKALYNFPCIRVISSPSPMCFGHKAEL